MTKHDTRATAFFLLALSNLFWSGNWVMGRALREAFDPISLNFWRWLVALIVLAPFALPGLLAHRQTIRRNAGLLFLLALTGVAGFQALIYLGLHSTEAVNGVLINCSGPLFMLLCSWAIERERATLRQVAGMLICVGGIFVIVSRGQLARLLNLELHVGDAWILLAMPVWGIYSVLLKRRPPELGGVQFLFLLSAAGVFLMLPVFLFEAVQTPLRMPTPVQAAGVLYMGLFASVGAFICWNRGVSVVGANAAGFSLYLLPVFGTLLAIAFLGESFGVYHAAGVVTIVAGVILATRKPPP